MMFGVRCSMFVMFAKKARDVGLTAVPRSALFVFSAVNIKLSPDRAIKAISEILPGRPGPTRVRRRNDEDHRCAARRNHSIENRLWCR